MRPGHWDEMLDKLAREVLVHQRRKRASRR
jgi:hypothetical protein